MSTSFWGQIFKAGSSEELQIPEDGVLTLTMLALNGKDGNKAQVFIETEGQKVLLCTLRAGTTDQLNVDLEFNGTQQVSFSVEGSGSVHATGFLSPTEDFDDDEEGLTFGDDSEEEGEEEEEEEEPVPPPKQVKKPQESKPVEKRKSASEDKPVAKKQQTSNKK